MIKYVEINCVSYFSINVSYIVSSKFFGERARLNFGKVVVIFCVIPTVAYSAERSFCVLRRPKQTLKVTMGQDCLIHVALLCIERPYVNRLDIEKVTDEFSPKKRSFQVLFPTNC